MSNPACSTVDTRPSPVPTGTVGLFEGAHYYHCGAFRPEYDCKMRALSVPFCARLPAGDLEPDRSVRWRLRRRCADPTAYAFTHEGRNLAEQHNLFRTGDGHIHALWFNFETGWHHEDRTAMLGAPPAVGDPSPYAFVARGPQPRRAAQPVPHRRRAHPRALVQLRERLAPRGPHGDAGRPGGGG